MMDGPFDPDEALMRAGAREIPIDDYCEEKLLTVEQWNEPQPEEDNKAEAEPERESTSQEDRLTAWQARAFNDCRLDHATSYILKGILAPGDLALIFGQPGAGKSLLGPLLAHAVASGRAVFGRRVRQGRVLYIAAEAGADMEVRFRAMGERYGPTEDLYLLSRPMDLHDPAGRDLKALQAVIKELRPNLILLDTVAAAFPGMEENEARDMGRTVRTLRSLGQVCRSAVVAIHHAPKAGDTPRGHGVLNGDCDVTLRVEGQDDEPRQVVAGKNRNGPSGPLFTFRVELVDLGTDPDGDPIRRPIAVEVQHEEAGQRPQGKPLSEGQQGWWRDLCDMFAEPGATAERVPVEGMGQWVTLTRQQVRDGFRRRGRLGDLLGNEVGNAQLTGAQRVALSKALNNLKDKGRIGMTDEVVWLLR